jgi:ketosteroid isomerase-like protein
VDGYADLFAADGTLLDAGMDQPLEGPAIRTSMARVLGLVPDFTFAPRRLVHQGDTVFVEADNRATLQGHELRWPAVYCITQRNGRVAAGRRYYDQAELYAPLRPGQPHALGAPGVVADEAAGPDRGGRWWAGSGGATARPAPGDVDLAARARAWRDGDLDTLLGPLSRGGGRVRFAAPGFAERSTTEADLRRHLRRVFALLGRPVLEPGSEATSGGATAVEWRGRAGAIDRAGGFGMVEILDRRPGSIGWRLAFDSLAVAGSADVVTLREHLQARTTAGEPGSADGPDGDAPEGVG